MKKILKAMDTDTPAVDPMPLKSLRRVPTSKLLFLFNSMLVLEYTPVALKKDGRSLYRQTYQVKPPSGDH